MNILTVASCYPVAHSPSDGIFIRSQCEALAAAGANVTVFAPRPWTPPGFQWLSNKWRTYRDTPEFYSLNGIPVYRPRHFAPPRSDLWMPVHHQYAHAASRLMPTKPDIIHAHFTYPAGMAGILLARRWKIPVVMTLHGDDVNVHPLKYPRLHRALLSSVAGADVVIAVSEALASRTAKLTGRQPVMAPIGVNLKLFSATTTKQEARRLLGLPEDGWIILHLGRLVEEKGIRDLLKAMGDLKEPKCHGLFVGLGPLAATVRAHPGCSVVGVQPNERVPLFLRAADVFVLPSYSEGMPTVLVEAGAAGLPVIATAVGGIPELLAGERGWMVPPKSPEALTEALRTVLGNPAETVRRAGKLKEHVMANYDVHNNARKLLSIYETSIEAHRKQSDQVGTAN